MRRVLDRVVATARSEGREVLLETEGLEIAATLGVGVPHHTVVADADAASRLDLEPFPGERVVVKVLSPGILHKSDVGGVAIVPRNPEAVASAVARMEAGIDDGDIAGYMVAEYVTHDAALGGQLLLGMRWTEDFGPVVTLGPGGIYAEFLSAALKRGRDVAILSPVLSSPEALQGALRRTAVTQLVTGALRAQPARIGLSELSELVARFLELARIAMPDDIAELEINPLVLAERGPVALDALVRLGSRKGCEAADKPLHKVRNLLEPRSMAIVGVSEQMNPGRIILKNVLREGLPSDRIYVVKPGVDSIDGCRCYPDVESLPEVVDLYVVCVAAGQVPDVVRAAIQSRKAESMILISGGLGERRGSEVHVEAVHQALEEARASEWRGPLLNGGNCLGIRSLPGRYDTLFIPHHKLSVPFRRGAPVALLSQSGAFAVARTSKLWALNAKYVVTMGNQVDLTVGDYLTYLKEDEEIEVFACYVEGFRPLDGRRWLKAAAEITASGRAVVLYRAGRTAAGAKATASHTASIAGDYKVSRELARSAGVLVAETLGEFEDLVRLCSLLKGKRIDGLRLGALSNAGFQCVSIGDNLEELTLADFRERTVWRIEEVFDRCRLATIVDVHNPLDLTPIMHDSAYEEVCRAVLADEGVDVGLFACVPLTGALNTLPPGPGHGEDLLRDGSIVQRMARLFEEHEKAWITVVDGGALYDPMALHFQERGVPVFRTVERGLRLFDRYCAWRLR
jgi:acyl-CoA synthetase (NDP forming)